MQLKNPATSKTTHWRLPYSGRISPSIGSQQQSLRHSPDGDPDNRLISQFGKLPGAYGPNPRTLAQHLENRLRPKNIILRTARHNAQSCFLCPQSSTGNRRIHITCALFRRKCCVPTSHRWLNGAHINHQSAPLNGIYSTAGNHHLLYHIAVFQHGDNDIGGSHCVSGGGRDSCLSSKRLTLAGGAIP